MVQLTFKSRGAAGVRERSRRAVAWQARLPAKGPEEEWDVQHGFLSRGPRGHDLTTASVYGAHLGDNLVFSRRPPGGRGGSQRSEAAVRSHSLGLGVRGWDQHGAGLGRGPTPAAFTDPQQ